jgi:hypothetical protein
VLQVGFSLQDYIEMHGQQNVKSGDGLFNQQTDVG